ncbi:hypothetical protein SDC9_60145 [bioreactor metagenome]|uniref:Quinohemoprotein amine dehydrogenase alpha subunit haem binding domain-containing protein n=1 Tax=bioreactor metagenome TaxID=1076179 RepID=A0A644XC40_9ZZZZ
MKKFFPVMILIFVLMFVLMGCSQATTANSTSAPTQANTDAASPTTATTLDGKGLLEARCVTCHTLAKVASEHGDATQWQRTVTQMVQKGAQLTTEEQQVLVEYLAANFQ